MMEDNRSGVERKFTIQYTLVIKGLAVLMLCAHHMFWRQVEIPIDFAECGFKDLFVPITKTCVALFTILSGYGLYESSKKWNGSTLSFTYKHLKKLLVGFWWVYIPFFIMSFFLYKKGTPIEIYGNGITGLCNFLLDAIGMRGLFNTPTLNQTWWYMETIIVLYLAFPVLLKIIKKNIYLPLIISGAIIALNNIYAFFSYERELLYFFPFIIGMICSKLELFHKLVSVNKKLLFWIVSWSALVISMFSTFIFPVIGNSLFSLSIIVVMIGIMDVVSIRVLQPLILLGKYSMDIFLIHSFMYNYFRFFPRIVFFFNNKIIGVIILIVLSLIISIAMEFVKKKSTILIQKVK